MSLPFSIAIPTLCPKPHYWAGNLDSLSVYVVISSDDASDECLP